jgi:hypothetical protein
MNLILMKLKALHFLLLVGLQSATQVDARFPEIGFCPLGGPPGWLNRMNGQSHRYDSPYYLPPPYPVRSPYMPYRGYAYSAPQFSSGFIQKYPVMENKH